MENKLVEQAADIIHETFGDGQTYDVRCEDVAEKILELGKNPNIIEIESGEIESKRLQLPVKVKVKCPNCGHEIEINFERDYLSYPAINEFENVGFCCYECETDSEVMIKLKVGLEVDYNSVKIQ